MKHLLQALLTLLLFSFTPSLARSLEALPAQVIIIRHGEKPRDGDSLNTRGRERAAALAPFFQETKEVLAFGTPVAIYAFKPSKTDTSKRSIETVTPLAEALNITINKEYVHDDYKRMVAEIKTRPEYNDRMVLICWEHHLIPEITRAFGALQSPSKWNGDAFDRLWIITFNKSGKASFQNLPQKLLFGDSQN